MTFSTVLFDLDGTLLDTLGDLAASVNFALTKHRLPQRSIEEVRAFLGNGIRNLMEKAVPERLDPNTFEAVFADFRTHYVAHSLDTTRPYPGIETLLTDLKKNGVRMGIISNKLDAAVQDLNRRFFSSFMGVAVGESPIVRRKPNPDAVLEAMRRLRARPETTLYVGDSEVDFATSRAAGLPCALVLWGFRDEPQLRALKAEHYAHDAAELRAVIL